MVVVVNAAKSILLVVYPNRNITRKKKGKVESGSKYFTDRDFQISPALLI